MLLISSGMVSVILGVLGMFIPVLPTTPFLLLAAYCFSHSSERFYNWLINNRCCGEYIRNYREGKGIPVRQKIITIILLWLMIGFTIWQYVNSLWLILVLFLIAVLVSIHILKIRTFKPKTQKSRLESDSYSQNEPINN